MVIPDGETMFDDISAIWHSIK